MLKFDRNILAHAKVKERFPLTKNSSSKQTWHITLDMEDVHIDYEPGDSIGIFSKNDPILVEHLIEALQAKPGDVIVHKRSEKEMTLHLFFTYYANLTRITSSFIRLIHESKKNNFLENLLSSKEDLRTFLAQHDPLSLIREYAQTKLPLQELCDQFGPMLPRFYSIASSKRIHKDTLDLTVALFTWDQGGEKRYGVASHFLCNLAEIGKTAIPLYVQPAEHFRLPNRHDTDIIMIGPGTGIAPFRAFLQERSHFRAKGNHWLFFGERNRKSDYFYEEEWKSHQNLQMHTAFSRDQEEKIYVQDKLLENGKELYEWLQNGAHLYICGDAKEMAKDVEKALQSILMEHGSCNEPEARAQLKALRKEGRYLLDVY